MFNDVNKVTLLGNVTNDPDLRFTPNGSQVISFGLATNRRYKKSEEWVDDTTFHNIVVWGNLAENLAKRIYKGTRMYVEGRLQTRSWEGNDGKRNYKTEVVASDVSLVSRFKEGKNSELPTPEASSGSSNPTAGMQTGADLEAQNNSGGGTIDPDDLPF